MQLVVIVLNKTDCLEEILEELAERKITGCTVVDSRGMAHSLYAHDELKFVASLRLLLDPTHHDNKTIFMAVKDEKVQVISEIVNRITGGLDQPDSGVMFAVPVSYVEGLEKKK